jgi:predicted acyl esterase
MCLTASWHAKEQRVAEIQIEFDVPAEMRDGTVLLSRLPYGKHTPMMLDPLAAARRGFLVVIQDTRGRFASAGEWEPWTYEQSDGYDTVGRQASCSRLSMHRTPSVFAGTTSTPTGQ